MKMWIRSPFAFAALVTAASLAACSDDDDVTGGNNNEPPQSGLVEIELTAGNRFVPAEVTIEPGTTVRWIREPVDENAPHTITPREDEQSGVWDRKAMPQGEPAFEHTFTVADQVYDYFCEPHEGAGMLGTITVVEE